ncbi:MAG TPA: two-component regulator propeller domain-containing protein [Terracidiphilus sp.]|nr:two-component regulator propeller domain-containing protein [Terracidiphilus sp.]
MKKALLALLAIGLFAPNIPLGAAPANSKAKSTGGSSTSGATGRLASMEGPRFRFENFTTANGLPDNHVYSVLVDGDRVWAGTDNGLALYEGGKWKAYTPKDGLAHRAVLCLALDKRTGDVWAGTMGGLSRISGGRIDTFTQLNSGLSNDVVYGVAVENENVWVATAAGASRLDLSTGQWSLYNERNTPMNEIWVYGVSAAADKVYYAVWGSGLLEYNQKTKVWDKYDDPDGETEMVLFKDQGLIHEITTSVSYVDHVVWVATYFGDSRYDGRYWHNFLTKDSGLPSNFTNVVKGVDANRAWFGTDKGLAYYDGVNWTVYRPSLITGKPEMTVRDAQGHMTDIPVATAPAHHYILNIDFQGQDIWVATAKGLSHGILQSAR